MQGVFSNQVFLRAFDSLISMMEELYFVKL
jgi:hypothetical protein